jgi:Asp/Glu/hydantoin racemase
MKIWYQSGVDFSRHPRYQRALQEHFARTTAPGTEVLLNGRKPDAAHDLPLPDVLGSPIVYHTVVIPEFVEALLAAERVGADAFVVGSFSEPILPELRSLARIPVVSLSESTFLAACSIAPRIGIVTINELVVPFIEKSLVLHQMTTRITGVHVVPGNVNEHELEDQFDDPAPYLTRVEEAARIAIAAGAQVIIPAEGVFGVMVAANGLNSVAGVPIIDPIATPVLFAEFAAVLKARTGVTHSRVAFPPPSAAARAQLFTR